ncbi:hypothetical protein DFS34DRAFT_330705 [Phlyctochytrium arcticum]|nr:hypothetical protein DFS34DRAFT_330705 [Phlyctochytrium arcticum]
MTQNGQRSVDPLFYGCYLLSSEKPGCRNTYVGSTPDPMRRLRQHNGEIQGGAKKTERNRPWLMVAVVHGFPNKYAALQFEWAWQKPHLSRHFRVAYPGAYVGARSESTITAKLRVLLDMLLVDPWQRWPLSVYFTKKDISASFASLPSKPPAHVKVEYGPLSKLASKNDEDSIALPDERDCLVCFKRIEMGNLTEWLTCPNSDCQMVSHLYCLSQRFLETECQDDREDGGQLLPVMGECPLCLDHIKWGDMIRSMSSRLAQDGELDAEDFHSDSSEESTARLSRPNAGTGKAGGVTRNTVKAATVSVLSRTNDHRASGSTSAASDALDAIPVEMRRAKKGTKGQSREVSECPPERPERPDIPSNGEVVRPVAAKRTRKVQPEHGSAVAASLDEARADSKENANPRRRNRNKYIVHSLIDLSEECGYTSDFELESNVLKTTHIPTGTNVVELEKSMAKLRLRN